MKETVTISAINLKGGCAKTSTILNLAGVLRESGRKPILFDCDIQESATIHMHAPGSPSHKEFKDLMKFVLTNFRK